MNLGWKAAVVVVASVGALTSGVASATTPPTDPAPTTTVAGTTTTTTVAPGMVAGPTPPRGGSASGDLVHDSDGTDWDLQRIATNGVLGLVALAVAGHLYGRMQSTQPTAPAATRPPS